MSYHDILVKVGDFGLYQKLLCGIFVFYTTFLCGLNFYTQVLIILSSKPFHQKSKENNLEQRTGVHLQHACSSLLGRRDRLWARKSRSLMGGGSALGAKGERLPKLLPHARRERDQDKVQEPLIHLLLLPQDAGHRSRPVHSHQVMKRNIFWICSLINWQSCSQAQRDKPGGGKSSQVVRPGLEFWPSQCLQHHHQWGAPQIEKQQSLASLSPHPSSEQLGVWGRLQAHVDPHHLLDWQHRWLSSLGLHQWLVSTCLQSHVFKILEVVSSNFCLQLWQKANCAVDPHSLCARRSRHPGRAKLYCSSYLQVKTNFTFLNFHDKGNPFTTPVTNPSSHFSVSFTLNESAGS